MNAIIENTSIQRKCTKCKSIKPLDSLHFSKDKNRPYGFMYKCKTCEKGRKETRIWSDRWAAMTDDQKNNSRKAKAKYGKTQIGRSIIMLKGYQKFDEERGFSCDLNKYDIFEA